MLLGHALVIVSGVTAVDCATICSAAVVVVLLWCCCGAAVVVVVHMLKLSACSQAAANMQVLQPTHETTGPQP